MDAGVVNTGDEGQGNLELSLPSSHPILLPHAAPKYLMIPQWSIINRPFTVIAANGFMRERQRSALNLATRGRSFV